MSDLTTKEEPKAQSSESSIKVTKKEDIKKKTMEITLNTSFGFSTTDSIDHSATSTSWDYYVYCEQIYLNILFNMNCC